MATALITGGSGLIGQWVTSHWDVPGIEPVLLDHRIDDLLTSGVPSAVVERLKPQVVVHLAWVASSVAGYRNLPQNKMWVDSSLELERACRNTDAWLIATGTAVDNLPTAADEYSKAKQDLRRAFASGIQSGEVTWLRPYYVFDPAQRRPALVDDALTAAAKGKAVDLRAPESRHDFIHASDVGRAVVETVRHRLRGEVAIGSGRLRRVRDLVAALGVTWSRAPGSDEKMHHSEGPADIQRLLAVGWSPAMTEEVFAGE